jgi:hypothetical protein
MGTKCPVNSFHLANALTKEFLVRNYNSNQNFIPLPRLAIRFRRDKVRWDGEKCVETVAILLDHEIKDKAAKRPQKRVVLGRDRPMRLEEVECFCAYVSGETKRAARWGDPLTAAEGKLTGREKCCRS